MSLIAKLIEYLGKYGNCQIYLTNENPNINRVLNFNFYKDFSIGVTDLLNDYNKPFWNGKEFDKTAIVLNSNILRSSYSYKNLYEYIAHIVRLSIMGVDNAYITYKNNVTNFDTKVEVDKICRIVYSMLYISNRQLVQIFESVDWNDDKKQKLIDLNIYKMLINNMQKNIGINSFIEVNSDLIDDIVSQISIHYKEMYLLHNTLFSSVPYNEYVHLRGKLNKYSCDDTYLTFK